MDTNLLAKKIKEAHLWEKTIDLERNEFLKVKGQTDTNLYYVIHGSLRIFVYHESEEHTIRLGYKDNFIASLDSFISESPSNLCIQSIKKTQLKVISKKSFLSFIHSSNPNLQIWLEVLNQLIYQQIEREQDLLITSPIERYKRVLQRSPLLFQEIPNKYIASYLRMTPETLSRIKKS